MGNIFHKGFFSNYTIVETIPVILSELHSHHLTTYECFKNLIESAVKEIFIVSFCCNLSNTPEGTDILNRLVYRAKSIKITIIVDEDSFHGDYEKTIKTSQIAYRKLNIGILNGDNTGNLLGNFWVIDRKDFYIGSAYLTGKALVSIKNLGIYSSNNKLSHDLYLRCVDYEMISKNQCTCFIRFATKYHIGKHSGTFFSDSPQHMIGSSRTYDLDCIMHYIDIAQSTIDIELVSFLPTKKSRDTLTYWPLIFNALLKASIERNVKLRILLGYWKMTDAIVNATIKSLHVFGGNSIDIATKLFLFPCYATADEINNSKILLVDNKFAHIMTANIDGSHFDSHSFVSFNCMNIDLVKSLQDIFERDWTSVYAKHINTLDN